MKTDIGFEEFRVPPGENVKLKDTEMAHPKTTAKRRSELTAIRKEL